MDLWEKSSVVKIECSICGSGKTIVSLINIGVLFSTKREDILDFSI